ncbi:hypothetical protein LR69_01100 [Geobacillus sp. BCO2]|nr:hypothetical protein LR69_01100 [Geobacillus sp. BCO2]
MWKKNSNPTIKRLIFQGRMDMLVHHVQKWISFLLPGDRAKHRKPCQLIEPLW